MDYPLKREERAIFELRALYRKYGYSQFKMSKFEEYDLYARNKDFLVSDGVITFTDTDGRNILIHAGLDTVKLQGEGLTVHVKAGDTVSAGDLVMEMNLDTIRSAGLSTIVITTIIPE